MSWVCLTSEYSVFNLVSTAELHSCYIFMSVIYYFVTRCPGGCIRHCQIHPCVALQEFRLFVHCLQLKFVQWEGFSNYSCYCHFCLNMYHTYACIAAGTDLKTVLHYDTGFCIFLWACKRHYGLERPLTKDIVSRRKDTRFGQATSERYHYKTKHHT